MILGLSRDVVQSVLKKKGFKARKPIAGIANFSQSEPCAGHFLIVRGKAAV
jgi:hypothetical protein